MTEEVKQGLVVYCDGGARPNPGRAGWGMHGYLYADTIPKKGSGNQRWLLTNHGYVPKNGKINQFTPPSEEEEGELFAEEDDRSFDRADGIADNSIDDEEQMIDISQEKEVTPVHYVEGFGSFEEDVTNNVAELHAATAALTYARDWKIDRVDVYTDSRYTRDGLTNWADTWMKNNFIKSDGNPVSNREHWKGLIDARDQLRVKGVKVELHWIEAHEGWQGNEDADQLATIAVLHARAGKTINEITTSVPEGFWKYDNGRHPFLNHQRMYFNAQKGFERPGEYYIGSHGKEDELLGKRISDGCYAAVFLKTPDPVIEKVRQVQTAMSDDSNSLVLVRLDQLFKANTHRQIYQYGAQALDRTNHYRRDMNTVDKQPLTRELKPALIGWRAVEAINFLVGQLKQYQDGNPEITATDLTAILYETVTVPPKKKGGETTTAMNLKSEYNVGYAALGVEANYKDSAGEVKQATIILTLGIDALDRNSFNRLSPMMPKVTLITWPDSPESFRYATIVEANGDVGIWAGVHSNLRIVPTT